MTFFVCFVFDFEAAISSFLAFSAAAAFFVFRSLFNSQVAQMSATTTDNWEYSKTHAYDVLLG